MKELIVKVRSEHSSKIVQKHAFKLGYFWESNPGKDEPQYVHAPLLFLKCGGEMRYGDLATDTPVEMEDFLKLSKKDVCDSPVQKYDVYYFDSTDPVLWKAFVARLDYALGRQLFNEETVGMSGYSYIYDKGTGPLSRGGVGYPKNVLNITCYADLDKIKKQNLLPRIHGYDGIYKPDEGIIKYGCAEIHVELLKSARSLCAGDYKGNRFVKEIVLDSGISISYELLNQILDAIK